jgi:hypothetical protein
MLVNTAKTEMEMYTDLFNKIAKSCFQKCASRKHRDQDLSLGEMTCTGTLFLIFEDDSAQLSLRQFLLSPYPSFPPLVFDRSLCIKVS